MGAPALQPLAKLAILVADGADEEACARVPAVRQAIPSMLDLTGLRLVSRTHQLHETERRDERLSVPTLTTGESSSWLVSLNCTSSLRCMPDVPLSTRVYKQN